MSFYSLMNSNKPRKAKYLNFIFMTETLLPKCRNNSGEIHNFILLLLALEQKTGGDKNMKFILTNIAIAKLNHSIRSLMTRRDGKRLGALKRFLMNQR